MRSSKVSPLSGRTLSQQSLTDGGTIPSGVQANVDSSGGAVSLFAPGTIYPTPELAAFMVFDAGRAASTNAITIDGNGRLINGESSFELATSGATVLFLYDQDADAWVSALLPRTDPVAAFPFFLKSDADALFDAGGGFTVAREVDFTTLANQALNVDGDVVIGADTWTKRGTANEVSTAIVNGTGLVIVPANGSDNVYGGFTMPRIDIPLASMLPADVYGPGMRLRVSVYDETSMAGLTSFPAAVYGVYWNTAGASGFWIQRGINAPGEGIGVVAGDSTNNYGAKNGLLGLDATNEIQELLLPSLGSVDAIASYGAPSAGNFPQRSDLVPFVGYGVDPLNPPLRTSLANARLFLGARRVASANPISVTIKRIRVEYAE